MSEARDAVRTALVVGPVLTCVGIAWTAVSPSTFSKAAILVGFATAVWGTHRFGRKGFDEPVELESPDDDAEQNDSREETSEPSPAEPDEAGKKRDAPEDEAPT